MSNIKTEVSQLIGSTPMLVLVQFKKANKLKATILAKLEYFNPSGSVKDRIARAMIEDGIKNGLIKNNTVIVEPTSGNTGIGLASVAASKGLKIILTMPETMSIERRKLLAAYGAQIVLTEGAKGMKGAIEKACQIAKDTPNAYMPSQFDNPSNADAHFKTTGPEIWQDTCGNVDIFISGIGTGGTITGAGRYLRSKNPNLQIYAVEPSDSPMLSKGLAGPHKIQGLGAGFVPSVLDTSIYNQVITVTNDQAICEARSFSKTSGVLVGISSGAALFAAKTVASKAENDGKTIVVILPDTGERYLSTQLFEE